VDGKGVEVGGLNERVFHAADLEQAEGLAVLSSLRNGVPQG
jgi:hypothetical protein